MALPANWHVFESAEAVANSAVEVIIAAANQAIADKGRFNLVTAGGSTPNKVYQLLAQLDDSVTDWRAWHIYMGDERVLPAADSERNSKMLRDLWLNQSVIPDENKHLMRTELGLEASAEDYREQIQGQTFDVVMLGMGEDGHTASLFPGHNRPSDRGVLCETESPKMPPERISLDTVCLGQTDILMKIITGNSKQEAMAKWLASESLPINQVTSLNEEMVLLDKAALPIDV